MARAGGVKAAANQPPTRSIVSQRRCQAASGGLCASCSCSSVEVSRTCGTDCAPKKRADEERLRDSLEAVFADICPLRSPCKM